MWVSLKYTFFVTVGKTTGSYVATMVSPIRVSPVYSRRWGHEVKRGIEGRRQEHAEREVQCLLMDKFFWKSPVLADGRTLVEELRAC